MGIRPRRPVERDHLARNTFCLFSRNGKCLYGPIDFSLGVGDRLAGFSRQQAGKLITPVIESTRDLLQCLIARVGRQRPHCSGCVDCRLNCRLGICRARARYLGKEPTCKWVVDGYEGFPPPPQTSNQELTWFLHERRPVNGKDSVGGMGWRCRSRLKVGSLLGEIGFGDQILCAPVTNRLKREGFIR